ncbi:hypothetical protein [Streptomyces longisporoflavus]|uniref:FXSXX-COOH protein n=1 Tax=Streptomyces longisporoflavus TaxID=28044 RepID=A0ABW7QQM3_9ACTN|nr:hypothetical protein [Streptomyces longisporoflavus]GGV28873.1 hypothetical protein GCM10010277_11330 [Streptomyces longisporoflavus]
MTEQNGVESELVDLGAVSPADARTLDAALVEASMQRLLSRIDDPASSMGGYNPQRDE